MGLSLIKRFPETNLLHGLKKLGAARDEYRVNLFFVEIDLYQYLPKSKRLFLAIMVTITTIYLPGFALQSNFISDVCKFLWLLLKQ